LIGVSSATAGVQHFEARIHEATWSAGAEGMSCTLSHEIPHYGRVEFRRQGARDLTFSVHVKRPPLLKTEAELSSDPPAWKHHEVQALLDPMDGSLRSAPFVVQGARARRVMIELEKGMAPTLRYRDWADGMDQVTVAVSPLFFRTAQREFLDCVRDFSRYGLDEGEPSVVYFEFNTARLTALGQQVLDQTVAHLKRQPGRVILVAGHASSEGTEGYNHSLSRKRAIVVRNYLMRQGIPRSRFDLRFFGENRPIASNDTELGRIKNRRVEITTP
jgi:outer membrane protein OmpA-like peptidoglycan-associated protein